MKFWSINTRKRNPIASAPPPRWPSFSSKNHSAAEMQSGLLVYGFRMASTNLQRRGLRQGSFRRRIHNIDSFFLFLIATCDICPMQCVLS
jgi:hypothetical protein